MTLSAGTRLGTYEIIGVIGAGGMGEVYRARDTKLNRDVALKILPDPFASDPDRLARFEREAQVLASLNHQNIAQIYGVEETTGTRALVMELVDGQTLDQMTATMRIGDVVAIARQIAGALEAAHAQGIIHRDLKPSNVKVRADGTVKLLDFGLAKAFDVSSTATVDPTNSPTLTDQHTQVGVVIGTAAYMAPEQARGKLVDSRADVWALGAVLFELLAGQRAFGGDTVSDTIVSVLTTEPDWSKLRGDTPRDLVRLVKQCLRKEPQRRLQAAGDVRLMLEDVAFEDERPSPLPAARWSVRIAWAVAALVLGSAGAAWLVWSAASAREHRARRTVPMQLAPDVSLSLEEAPAFALSPDGTTLVFVGGAGNSRRLYVRRIDIVTVSPIAGTEGASSPFFSPDGQWIGFVANDALQKVRTTGATAPVRLASATDRGGVWTDDDSIIYAQGRIGPLFKIDAAGGEPVALTHLAQSSTSSHRFPTSVPETPAVLFTSRDGRAAPAIVAIDLRSGVERTVLDNAYHPVYQRPGRLLFMREAALHSVGFDAERLRVTGPETQLVDAIRASGEVMAGQFAASGGMLLYQPGTESASDDHAVVVWRAPDGRESLLIGEPDSYRDLRFSPDGRLIAYSILPRGLGGTDLWVFDRVRGLKTRVTHDLDAAEWFPVWTPDARALAYAESAAGIRMIQLDGSGRRETLTESKERWQVPVSFSPDGKYLAYHELNRETAGDLWILPLAPKGEPQVFLKTPFAEMLPMFSPDGRWIAYSSNESGSFELYVRPFPGPGARYQISGDQSFDMHYWSADGRRLFYRTGDGRRMMSVPVRTDGAELEVGKPTVLFELDPETYPDLRFWGSFAAAPDGSGFSLVKWPQPDSSARTYLMLMLDW